MRQHTDEDVAPRAPGGTPGPPADDWRAMATAPKDGRDILGAIQQYGRQLVIRWKADSPPAGAWVAADERVVHPTHWTALPRPPGALVPEQQE